MDTLPVPKKDRELMKQAFEKLLARLHPDRERAGEEYERLRGKLILYFEGRSCWPADEYADEVLSRTADKLDAGEELREIDRYVYGVARLLLLEASRQPRRIDGEEKDDYLDRLRAAEEKPSDVRMNCLEVCLENLPPDKKEIILKYYSGDEGQQIAVRDQLAVELNLTSNALKVNACRIRQKLEHCIDGCVRRAAG